ncbi:MAG: hypothetical protein ACI8PT_000063 [Gammaproteobacteria bacterium]|jgi:hypothetical protein
MARRMPGLCQANARLRPHGRSRNVWSLKCAKPCIYRIASRCSVSREAACSHMRIRSLRLTSASNNSWAATAGASLSLGQADVVRAASALITSNEPTHAPSCGLDSSHDHTETSRRCCARLRDFMTEVKMQTPYWLYSDGSAAQPLTETLTLSKKTWSLAPRVDEPTMRMRVLSPICPDMSYSFD